MRVFKIAVAAACAFAVVTVSPAEAATSRSISLTVPASLLTSTNFTFKGKVTRSPKGSTVTLQRKSGSTWKAVKTVKTADSAGNFSGTATSMSTANTYSYRAYAPKTSKLAAAASSTRKIVVRKKVSVLNFTADTLFPAVSAPVTFSGKVSPWVAGTPVKLYSRAGTSGSFISPVTVAPTSTGDFSLQVTPPASQLTQYRISVALTAKYSSATSPTLTVDTTDPEITTTALPDGSDSSNYSASLAVKGNRPGTWSLTSSNLPPQLTFDIPTGTFAGTNPAAGPYSVTVQFQDNLGRTDTATFSFSIDTGSLPVPAKVKVTTGQDDACRIKLDGTLQCWGHNWAGELGVGSTPTNQKEAPTAVGTGWVSVSSGLYDHTCGIKTDYTAWCWGRGDSGQLGNGLDIWYNTPQAAGAGMHFKQVNAGYHHSCGIRTDDTLWCWGASPAGGATVAEVSPGTTWKQVDAAQGFTCGIKTDDTLWCWGSNYRGWLGVGDTTERAAPTQVSGGGAWKQVSAGQGHTCGLKANDTLYCWGKNGKGVIGDGTDETTVPSDPGAADSSVPKAVSVSGLRPDTWRSVSASGMGTADHTCAVGDDNTLWCWGGNNFGESGPGLLVNNSPNPLPTKVGSDTDWDSVSSGATHTCAVKTDDTLWCWGSNGNGQIGQGNFVANYPNPTKVN